VDGGASSAKPTKDMSLTDVRTALGKGDF